MRKDIVRVLLVICAFATFILVNYFEGNRIIAEGNSTYPLIKKKDTLSGVIVELYELPRVRTTPSLVHLHLENGKKLAVGTRGPSLENSSLEIKYLSIKGAIIEKEPNSDTVYITHQGNRFTFLLPVAE